MNHLSEETLVLLYYNEAETPEGAREHLRECGECQDASAALAQCLNLCSELEVPDPGADFGRTAWARLAPALEVQKKAGWGTKWFRPQVWAMAASVAALLMVAFFAGRASRPAGVAVVGLSSDSRERILVGAVADHLDRAQALMTEISHSSGGEFSSERERAADLVSEGRLLRQTLKGTDNAGISGFLDDVERFMLETAHTPESASAGEVRALQERMESGSLLFKAKVTETNLRKEEKL